MHTLFHQLPRPSHLPPRLSEVNKAPCRSVTSTRHTCPDGLHESLMADGRLCWHESHAPKLKQAGDSLTSRGCTAILRPTTAAYMPCCLHGSLTADGGLCWREAHNNAVDATLNTAALLCVHTYGCGRQYRVIVLWPHDITIAEVLYIALQIRPATAAQQRRRVTPELPYHASLKLLLRRTTCTETSMDHQAKNTLQIARDEFTSQLTPQQLEFFGNTTLHDVETEAFSIQHDQELQMAMMGFSRFGSFLESFAQFEKTCVSLEIPIPGLSGFIWGPPRFILQVNTAAHLWYLVARGHCSDCHS